MATSIFFNGRLIRTPGSYSEVNTDALAAVGLGATGIVAVIGTGEGGKPVSVTAAAHPRGGSPSALAGSPGSRHRDDHDADSVEDACLDTSRNASHHPAESTRVDSVRTIGQAR